MPASSLLAASETKVRKASLLSGTTKSGIGKLTCLNDALPVSINSGIEKDRAQTPFDYTIGQNSDKIGFTLRQMKGRGYYGFS